MKLTVYLPMATGFDIEIDGEYFHSECSDITKSLALKEGKHIISVTDQCPAPTFWNKFVNLFNPFNQSVDDYSSTTEFELTKEDNVEINVKYGDYDFVDIVFEEHSNIEQTF